LIGVRDCALVLVEFVGAFRRSGPAVIELGDLEFSDHPWRGSAI
jgi:hypothetical protein